MVNDSNPNGEEVVFTLTGVKLNILYLLVSTADIRGSNPSAKKRIVSTFKELGIPNAPLDPL